MKKKFVLYLGALFATALSSCASIANGGLPGGLSSKTSSLSKDTYYLAYCDSTFEYGEYVVIGSSQYTSEGKSGDESGYSNVYTKEPDTFNINGYLLYKANLKETRSFRDTEFGYTSGDYDKNLTIAVEFDGKTVKEYYLNFVNHESKIATFEYDPLIVGDEAVPPQGYSGYDGDAGRLGYKFIFDENIIYSLGYFPNGYFLCTESYAKQNNYRVVTVS